MGRDWTEDEIKFLQDNYNKMPYYEIGKILGRTDKSISKKTKRLGLKLTKEELKIRKECTKAIKHGLRHKRLYEIWKGIKSRCFCKNKENYIYYGGKGITICEEWKNDPIAFYNWSMNNGYSDELTIDRIDVNGDYCPENCRWTTHTEQMNNTSRNRFITAFGETKTIADWFKDDRCNISYSMILFRLNSGLSPEESIFIKNKKSVPPRNEKIEFMGEIKTPRKWSEDYRCQVSYYILVKRIKNGIPLEKAILK